MIDHRPSSADKALASAIADTKLNIGGNSNSEQASAAEHASQIVQSGIHAQKRIMVHLWEFQAWFTPPGIRLPTQDTVVTAKVCAPDFDKALVKVRAWMAVSCKANKLAPDAYQLSYLAARELDLPLSDPPTE